MPASNIKLTLIGGPTVLIEYDGFRLLTDPTFDPPGEYQGPHSPVKHVKTAGPAISAEHVGKLDAVLRATTITSTISTMPDAHSCRGRA